MGQCRLCAAHAHPLFFCRQIVAAFVTSGVAYTKTYATRQEDENNLCDPTLQG